MSFLLKGKGREPAQLTYRSPIPPAPFVDGIQSDEPYVSYHSVHTAFPDAHHSDVDVQHFDFPYGQPEDADYHDSDPSAATLDPELASSVSYLPEAQILTRILGNGRTLELRWMGYVNKTSRKIKSDNETLIRISFPRTLRNISASKCLHLNPQTGTLTVVLLDQQDGIYRLQFDAPLRQLENGYMFTFDRHSMSRSTIDASYGTLQQQTVWSVYSDEGVAIGLEGSVLRCTWHGPDWSFFPIDNPAKPKSGRGWRFNSEPQQPHASQTIALTTFVPHHSTNASTFAYTLSRDRTLRSFNLTDMSPVGKVVNVHHGIEGLTRDLVERSTQLQIESEYAASEELTPQVPLLQVLPASDDDWHFIFVLSPTPKGAQGGAILRTYTAQIRKNDIVDLAAVGYISCSEETLEADFRGFAVEATPGLSALAKSAASQTGSASPLDEAVWKVWTAWDLGGQALVEWSSLTTMLRPGEYDEDAMTVTTVSTSVVPGRAVTNPWKKVHDLFSILEPEVVFDSTYIDELIDGTEYNPEDPSADIKELMLPFIFHPGRFAQHTLNAALAEYHANLPHDLQDAHYLEDPNVSIDIKVAEIIGCSIQLEEDEDTGLPKLAEYREDFKREYLGFWAGLQAQERQSRWPLLLAPSNGNMLSSSVIVVSREGIMAPTLDDEISLMVWLLEKAETDDTQQTAAEKAVLLTLDRESMLPYLSRIAEPARRREISMALSAASVVAKSMTTYERNRQQTNILDNLAQHLAGYSVDEAIEAILAENGFDSASMLELGPGVAAAFEHGYPARKAIESCLDILSQPLPISLKEHLTFFGSSIAVAAASQTLNLRSKVLFELLLVILVLRSGAADAADEGDNQEEWFDLIARATVILQRTLVAQWLTQWRSDGTRKLRGNGSDPAEHQSFRKLFVSSDDQTENLDPQTYYSMFHAFLMGLDIAIDSNRNNGDFTIDTLSEAALRTTPVAKFAATIDASARDVMLANRLFSMGLTEYAKAMCAFWPIQSGMAYVRAKAMVISGEAEEAAKIFLSLANIVAEVDWAQSDESGLADVLPADVRWGGLPTYYRHIMDVLETYGFVQQSTVFAELAVRVLPSTFPTAEDLHGKIFRAYITMGKYEEAYAAMIANPFANFATNSVGKERPLGDLIHAMCHNNQIQALLSLPFVGLENQVAQELTFRARNSDPMSTPNYYQILFAWHIMKTDYRQAGVTMYLQGRRIAEHLNPASNRRNGEASRSGEDYGNYLAKQAQCYLAVLQTFSLTDSKNSWFTVPATRTTPFLHEQKRRRASSLIPTTELSSPARDLQIVKLEDVKKEYSAVVALLTVIRRIGGELDPDAPLSLEDCIRYLCRDGLYDEAFLSAASYGCDMTEIFASLTERCLLSSPQYGDEVDATAFAWLDTSPVSSTWTGTLAERCWRYLQQMLQTHRPRTPPAGQYYQAVVQTALELNRHFPLPIWLLEWAVNDQSGGFETLIREALRWGLVAESVEWCRAYVMRSFGDMPVTLSNGAVRPVYTPYTTFDQVVAAVKAMPGSTDDEKRLKESAQRSVDELKVELERRAATLEGR